MSWWRSSKGLWLPSRLRDVLRDRRGVLVVPPMIGAKHESNITAAATTGTVITASATANTKGSYTSLIDPTSFPSYGIWVAFRNVHVSATVTNILVDISYGPTGGGNEQILIPDLNAGAAPTGTTHVGAKLYFFPVYVPTGTRVSARCQASTGSDTVQVSIWLAQQPLYPWTCGNVSVYGRDATNSRGTSVTLGTGAFGTWTELLNAAGGSGLSHPHRYWAMSMDLLADTTATDDNYDIIELGIGPNSGAVTTIAGPFQFQEEGAEAVYGPIPLITYAPVPVDATNLKLWARGSKTAGGEARGLMAWGMD